MSRNVRKELPLADRYHVRLAHENVGTPQDSKIGVEPAQDKMAKNIAKIKAFCKTYDMPTGKHPWYFQVLRIAAIHRAYWDASRLHSGPFVAEDIENGARIKNARHAEILAKDVLQAIYGKRCTYRVDGGEGEYIPMWTAFLRENYDPYTGTSSAQQSTQTVQNDPESLTNVDVHSFSRRDIGEMLEWIIDTALPLLDTDSSKKHYTVGELRDNTRREAAHAVHMRLFAGLKWAELHERPEIWWGLVADEEIGKACRLADKFLSQEFIDKFTLPKSCAVPLHEQIYMSTDQMDQDDLKYDASVLDIPVDTPK